jgi:hypothetical protein
MMSQTARRGREIIAGYVIQRHKEGSDGGAAGALHVGAKG